MYYRVVCTLFYMYPGSSVNSSPVDDYERDSLSKLVDKLRTTDTKLNPGVVSGQYKGVPCGPFLQRFSEVKMCFAVVGPNAELSRGMVRLIDLLVDNLAPGSAGVAARSGIWSSGSYQGHHLLHRSAAARWSVVARHRRTRRESRVVDQRCGAGAV